MRLTSKAVNDLFSKCLFSDGEVQGLAIGELPEGAIRSDGITLNAAFHPERLAESKQQIIHMLNHLPEKFFVHKGGGYTFLGMNMDKTGECWADTESTMQELVLLGQAIGAVKCCVPQEMWSSLPGGVPYYVIDTSEKPFTVTPKDPTISDDDYEDEIRKMYH